MTITIQCIDFTIKPELNEYIDNKVQKLTRLCADTISIEVSLKLDRSDTNENKLCGIRLVIPGNDMLASAQCKSFEEATSQAVEALERQIEKRKKKMTAKG